jgi:uncharacterized protein with NRDE domain
VCTILLAWRHLDSAPVVLAANRDELVQRPSHPPRILRDDPLVAGGQDALAGGTWLAVRADGTLAAVTNRRSGDLDPTRRSRGELPLLLLDAATDATALERLASLDPLAYNPFNALYASAGAAAVAHAHGDRLDLRVLGPGLHVLTVHDLDDRSHAKVAVLGDRLAALAASTGDDARALLAGMEALLTDHGEPGREGVDAACVHGDVYGTVSSSSVLVDAGGRITYRHAPGRPCVTEHVDVSSLLCSEWAAQLPSSG